MKYFYTDPHKGAWMQKEFGFKYEESVFSMPVDYEMCGVKVQSFRSGRIEIHPDYYEMLKPQKGDIVEFKPLWHGHKNKSFHGEVIKTYKKHIYICVMSGRGLPGNKLIEINDTYNIGYCDSIQNKHHGFQKIIQRNGIAFFMPECEE